MKRVTAIITLLISASAALQGAPARAASSPITRLIAEPTIVHQGDTIYLSGCCFPTQYKTFANGKITPAPETITEVCPNWSQNIYGIGEFHAGPYLDRRGQFVGYKWKQGSIGPFSKYGMTCTIYANVGDSPYGTDNPVSVQVVPYSKKISKKISHISVAIRTSGAIRPGKTETIRLSSWPGAVATVWVGFRGQKPQKMAKRLDWEGNGKVTWRARNVSHPTSAQIRVHVRLGNEADDTRAHFTVLD
ncbi:MAG: hypothetical protein ACRDFS_11315 [Chloroflexota bacterium]